MKRTAEELTAELENTKNWTLQSINWHLENTFNGEYDLEESGETFEDEAFNNVLKINTEEVFISPHDADSYPSNELGIEDALYILDLLEKASAKLEPEMKTFTYNGLKITPHRQFTKAEDEAGINLPLSSIGVSNYQDVKHLPNRKNDIPWNYDEFYKAAHKAGAGEYDVFLLNGKEVVPGSNELYELTERK